MMKRGSLVWGKMKSYPWWPAIVIDPEDCGRDRIRNNKLWLFWFGDNKITQVEAEKVLDFEKYFTEKSVQIKGQFMKKAIQELLIVSAKRHQFEYTDPSTLFHWANDGFKTCSGFPHNATKNELPDIVLKTLNKNQFKRKEVEETDSESDEDISKVIDKVRDGSTTLEDVCIICCKVSSFISMQHPLFVGGVCPNCKKCVDRINKAEFAKMQEICVICGQGGNLVYCSNNICLRSYCDLCLDCMVCRGSYLKIVKTENWKCYLCKPDSDKNCLIKRRNKYKSKIITAPPFPKEKLPIRVIAQSDTACAVLKKKEILIEVYCTEPSNAEPSGSRHYEDFSDAEFGKICADLVCGSFFLSSTTLQDMKEGVVLFFSVFYKFLFRLDNAKLFKPSVFFIFISDVELNSEMLALVLRFLQVDPVTVKVEGKEFLIWSNIPSFSCDTNFRFLNLKVDENKSVEEKILSKCIDPLKHYFKHIV